MPLSVSLFYLYTYLHSPTLPAIRQEPSKRRHKYIKRINDRQDNDLERRDNIRRANSFRISPEESEISQSLNREKQHKKVKILQTEACADCRCDYRQISQQNHNGGRYCVSVLVRCGFACPPRTLREEGGKRFVRERIDGGIGREREGYPAAASLHMMQEENVIAAHSVVAVEG